jgi:hypothetical protein
MAPKGYPTDILVQANDIMAACRQIDPHIKAGALTQADFATELTHTREIQAQIQALELQLTGLRNKRDERLVRMWDAIKRVRATVKGSYGDDSTEYELVGGTRMSERRRPARKAQG